MTNEIEPNGSSINTEPQPQENSLTKALWTLFSSMKMAIMLLLLLAIVSIIGTVIEQNAVPDMYIMRYGEQKYAFLKALGLTNMYGSGWYSLLLSLIGANLLVCSINRFGITWRRVTNPPVAISTDALSVMPGLESIESSLSAEESFRRVSSALQAESYKVTSAQDGSDYSVHAAKGNAGLWGPYLTHVSILIIFIGAIFGRSAGFEGYTTLVEGQPRDTYERTGTNKELNFGFEVHLNNFTVDYDEDHNPTAYKSDLSIYEADRLVAHKEIDVNHPITYRGVSLFQSDYGLAGFILKVTDPEGKVTQWPVEVETQYGPGGKDFTISGMPIREIKSGGKKITFFVHDMALDYSKEKEGNFNSFPLPLNPALKVMANTRFPEYKGLEAWAKLPWLPAGESAEHEGYTIELENVVMSSGLQVSKNPGIPILYAGFILLLLGILLSFYITRSVIRMRVSAEGSGASVALALGSRSGAEGFDRVRERIRNSLT